MTPAIIITTIYGDGAGDLLVMSQVGFRLTFFFKKAFIYKKIGDSFHCAFIFAHSVNNVYE